MTKKVFCGGLPWEAEDDDLAEAMRQFGDVLEAKVVKDRETGKSRGFGFVTFANETSAAEALERGALSMMGRTIRFDEANERPGRQNRGGNRNPGPPREDNRRNDGGFRDEGRGRGRRPKKRRERGGAKKDRW